MGEVMSSPDLLTAVRIALQATSLTLSSIGIAEESPPRREGSQFRELAANILYSRRFVLTYQAVILCFLVGFTVTYYASKFGRWRRKRRSGKNKHSDGRCGESQKLQHNGGVDSTGLFSSSCSTLEGSEGPSPKDQADEQTSLLPNFRSRTYSMRVVSGIRASLTYQPAPIPILNKTLPSNAMSLTIMILVAVNLFYALYNVPLTIPKLFVFADRTSLLFVANLPWLYILAAKTQPIKILTGYSYESLNIVHRRLGEIMCLLALLHSLGMVGVWYTLLRPVGFSFVRFILSKIILLGVGAFVAYESLYVTSLGSFRQQWYELFLGLHVFLQCAALVLLYYHHHGSRIYVGIALTIFLVDRLVYRLNLKASSHRASLRIFEDGMTVGLSISVLLIEEPSLVRRAIGSGIVAGWAATDHIFLGVPSISRKHIIQSHPFTIASRAPTATNRDGKLDFIIRAQDGFSGDLLRYAKGHAEVTVRLDGPYGSQQAVEMLQSSDVCVIIASGSGIAVTWPLVWATLEANSAGSADIENTTISLLTKKILFVWIVQKATHLSWLGKDAIEELRSHGVTVLIPPATEESGRPDLGSVINSWIKMNDNKLHNKRGCTGVVCSGPDSMGRTVRNVCAALQAQSRDISVSIEKFGW
ncbi:hypothetical protein MMC13_002417 [Lambiella insularis]|nr:hypothetical protein [Lambiella insularis]